MLQLKNPNENYVMGVARCDRIVGSALFLELAPAIYDVVLTKRLVDRYSNTNVSIHIPNRKKHYGIDKKVKKEIGSAGL